MNLDLDRIGHAVSAATADGYLIVADGKDPDQRYLSGFDAPDRFATLVEDEQIHLLVRGLEQARARTESRATAVTTPSDFEYRSLVETHGTPTADHRLHRAFLEAAGVSSVLVNPDFPLSLADGLRSLDVTVTSDDGATIPEMRAVKSADEIDAIETTQRATEAAMDAAIERLSSATVGDNGELRTDGKPLTSERLRTLIDRTLLDHQCAASETIVAGGPQGADPHTRGSGQLQANSPIVIDIFPRHKGTHYHADMTRTVVVGEASDRIRTMYETVATAKAAAIDAIESGIPAAEVHAAACAVIEEAGFPTMRTDDDPDRGFIHSTGHGVGLAVHERPSLSDTADATLESGNVVTVEPGLYEPDVGGVRLEDLLVVTENGSRNLTTSPTRLEI